MGVEGDLGDRVTYMDQLERYGHRELGDAFLGVHMLDRIPRVLPEQCLIANTDLSSQPGEHWVAFYRSRDGKLYQYDSFGRAPARLMPGALKRAGGGIYGHVDRDAEQRVSEENCGQRCLAWLVLAKNYGAELAALV